MATAEPWQKAEIPGPTKALVLTKPEVVVAMVKKAKRTLDTIPTNDADAFALMSRGDVMGIFQVEGEGMRRVLDRKSVV